MPSTRYVVKVDTAAYFKMYAHEHFLAQVSVPAAQRLHDAFESALNSLEENPCGYLRYEPHSKIEAELHRMLFAKRYRIVFEIRGDTVYIYDVQDCRQDIDKNLV